MFDPSLFQSLAIAAAIGFIIGFEREWRDRAEGDERTFAGARTFTLVALVGALAATLDSGFLLPGVALAAVGVLAAASYWAQARNDPHEGGTTEISLIATFLLGALAARGEPALAAAAGVFIAVLLSLKPMISGMAQKITAREIAAALRFLAISVIVLPILPDRGYGPYEALNPQKIWWMVVLISGLSFAGYWLTKMFGSRGVLMTGLVGGLASSTATTLSLSRLVRDGAADPKAGAAGIVAANVVMLARIGVVLSVLSAAVLQAILPALVAGGVVGAAAAFWFWRGAEAVHSEVELGNPMELRPALFFAALLAGVLLASRFASDWFGDQGLYILALVTGFADVDAMTLTAGAQAGRGAISPGVAAIAVMIAAAANMAVKGAMSVSIAGKGEGWRVAAAFVAILVAAAGALVFAPV